MIKLFEMFAGYGGGSFALKKAGLDHEVVGYSEIDKYAIQCYEQNHKGKNFGDCTKINPYELEDFDLLTGGFPCQSFSAAGKGLGEQDTRGTLFNEIIRIAEVKQPKYMLLENVKGFTFKKFKDTFNKVLGELDRIGYTVYWKVLNSKDFGIPQNRERVCFICFRKDIENHFEFPEKEELKLTFKDLLEEGVDEKYFLTESNIKTINRNFGSKGKILNLNCDISLIEKMTYPSRINQKENETCCPTLTTAMGTGGGNVPAIQLKKEISQTLTTELSHGTGRDFFRGKQWEKIYNNSGELRRLTPKECFRLMGFLNDEINLDGLSDTQRYKLAGNGWDINLVAKIFKNMLRDKSE